MLHSVKMTNVGPSSELEATFGRRLTLLTGKNGLGKSFLLDSIWWCLTRKFPAEINPKIMTGKMAVPTDMGMPSSVEYVISSTEQITYKNIFNQRNQDWEYEESIPQNTGFVFYAMADGGYAIWDPLRNYLTKQDFDDFPKEPAYIFSQKELWDGLRKKDGTQLCNGLLIDWANWQKENGEAFKRLKSVLKILSPLAEEQFIPGSLRRISITEVRDIPTLKTTYGQDVPVLHTSSGIRRILSLSYLLVWSLVEHKKAKDMVGEISETNAVFLVDEAEAQLHPGWQRTILPSLLAVCKNISKDISAQMIVSTKSPLVMASVEPYFTSKTDAWLDFDIVDNTVVLSKREFYKLGTSDNWLTSEAFDMKSTRSIEAEACIEKASLLLSCEHPSRESIKKLKDELNSVLSETDLFWVRWNFIFSKKGWKDCMK